MKMKLKFCLTGVVLLLTSPAHAAFITGAADPNYSTAFQGASAATFAGLGYSVGTGATDLKVSIGTYTDPSGLTFGNMITPNATAYGTTYNKMNYGYSIDAANSAYGNSRDYKWVQNTGTNASGNTALDQPWLGTVWDLGGQANQAVVFPIVDHSPLPQEVVEYTVYLTNTPGSTNLADWSLALLDQVYLQGWEADGTSLADGFTTVWKLPGGATFRYVSLQGIGSQAIQPYYGNEDEIDAVAGLTAEGGGIGQEVPEPGALAIAGLGLVALGLMRRRKPA
jgi:hypothetical protein